MLTVTLSSLRSRWATLVGTLVALGLGVALIATMGLALASTGTAPPQPPSRLAGAPVVVRGADELRVPTRIGDRVQPLAQPHEIPPALAAALSTKSSTVADRSFPVLVDIPGQSRAHTGAASPAPAATSPLPFSDRPTSPPRPTAPSLGTTTASTGPASRTTTASASRVLRATMASAGPVPRTTMTSADAVSRTTMASAGPVPSGATTSGAHADLASASRVTSTAATRIAPTPAFPAGGTSVSRATSTPADRGAPEPAFLINSAAASPTPNSPTSSTSASASPPPRLEAPAGPAGPVGSEGADRLVGHPWGVAGFGGHRLVAGREPRELTEITLAADPALVGRTVFVWTPAGSGYYTVSGVLTPVPFERAVFFADGAAAAIAPRIDNLVVDASPEAVRAVAAGYPSVRVLTGDDRRLADNDPDRDADALVAMNALLGTAAGVTTFVSVFVVASTFAFAVAQRRREIGLLRLAGATPRQIRRAVLAEAAVVGVVASAAGCVLGSSGAPWLARLLVDERLAPTWFTIGDHRWPYHVAFWTGLVVALAGVMVATVRAGRVSPTEALREASVDSRAMTAGRWVFGIGILAAGLGLLCWRLLTDPGEALHRKTYTTQPMLLITAVALLAPVLAGPVARLVAWLPARLPGATGMLMRENTSAGRRRTAAVAAPVLITVALAGSLLGTTATITGAEAEELRARTTADLIVTGTPDARTVAAIRAVPGAEVMTSASTSVYTLEDGVALVRSPAQAVDAEALSAVRRLPVEAGDVGDLDDDGIIVNEEWAEHTVGARVDVWLGDGTPRTLRIVAVLAIGTGGDSVYVTTRNAGGASPDLLELSWHAGADTLAGETAVRDLLEPSPPSGGGPGAGKAGRPEPSGRPGAATSAGATPTTEATNRGAVTSGTATGKPATTETANAGAATGGTATAEPAITGMTNAETATGGTGTGKPATTETAHAAAAASGAAVGGHAAGPATVGGPTVPGAVRVQTREQWLAAQAPVSSRQTRVGYLVVLGIALLYTGIAIANTMVMATSDRARELAVLRLAGATRRQVLRLVAAEALTVVVVGAVLGLFVTALNLLGIWAALATLSVWASVIVPWTGLAVTLAACAVVAVLAAALPAAAALRTRPVELAGTRE
ncbi:FtsX-like permease family protein [Actinoplanes sp. CA-252034]|uniref:FtsX-like permease family protein n=1 Tax=Actinoplanes sp. CA-252034 TaxID=3239906 RepID=UPI003D96A6C5